VWQERFLADVGKQVVPGIQDLYSDGLRKLSHLLVTGGVLATTAGILFQSEAVLNVSLGAVFFGVLCFAVNFVMMARWALLRLDYRPEESDRRKFDV
jgi:hypothetical protein